MTEIRKRPCSACPYRTDVPSGVWSRDEYDKLRRYDVETPFQPARGFSCHATPDFYCHGWAMVHTSRGSAYDVLALRIDPPTEWPDPSGVELFDSGAEAADHGQRDADSPDMTAVVAIEKLVRQHARLR